MGRHHAGMVGVIAQDGSEPLDGLARFRGAVYAAFGRRRDALFDLVDALLTTAPAPSLVHLCLAPVHRCGRGSLYAALRRGQVDGDAVRARLLAQPRFPGPPVFAVDVSVWPRRDAETSPERDLWTKSADAMAASRERVLPIARLPQDDTPDRLVRSAEQAGGARRPRVVRYAEPVDAAPSLPGSLWERYRTVVATSATPVDLLDRILDKGVVVAGDVDVAVADVDLLTLRLRLVVCSVGKVQEIGLDWWTRDPTFLTGRPPPAPPLPAPAARPVVTVRRARRRRSTRPPG